MDGHYELFVSKDDFKFSSAHFMAYPGFREKLHGHNYRLSVRVEGALGSDGYVVDFGDIKQAARRICKELDERVLVPCQSDCLEIDLRAGRVHLTCEDGSHFELPEPDCVLLPIEHSSTEDLAAYICGRLREAMDALPSRRLSTLEVAVAEAPGQEARFRIQL